MRTQKNAWTKAFLDLKKRKWLFGFRQTSIVSLMLKHIRRKDKKRFRRILDVGCGSGRNTLALARMGFDAYGMDFVKPAISVLKRRAEKEGLKINAIVQDVTKPWPFPNNFFDAAMVNVVLDSIHRDGRFFIGRELARTLRKNGLVFVYEPSANDGYYSQFIGSKSGDRRFVCPDDNIKREIFTKESILEPFRETFDVKFIQERFYEGKMFWRNYRRAWWFVVLENNK